jgi:3-deoxy-D-manno-octulosonic-acid transferase
MLYNLSVWVYSLFLQFASLFHAKARLWVQGRKQLWQKLEKALQLNQKPVVWFHVASLGEFEQARPIIEGLRSKHQNQIFILLTFFSPSGYEVRKDYKHADYITYLPTDLPAHAKRWVAMVKPSIAFWVKYEFWWNVLQEMQRQQIPIVLFSAVFRQEHYFFKPSAQKYVAILQNFTQIFVQNEESLELLQQYQFQNAQRAGDTRFDRVWATVEHFETVLPVETWCKNLPTLVAGSVWERDLEVILPALQDLPTLQAIVAPHEMSEHFFQKIERALPTQTIRYSQIALSTNKGLDKRILIIDNVGMLSRLYKYGSIAYIGGAFKEGLHNILEPAAFALPVIFGKDYRKFPEAYDLIKVGGAFSIKNKEELTTLFQHFLQNEQARLQAGKASQDFIKNNRGGAAKILTFIENQQLC